MAMVYSLTRAAYPCQSSSIGLLNKNKGRVYASKSGSLSNSQASKGCRTCRGQGAIECPGCKGTGKNKKNGNIFERWKVSDQSSFAMACTSQSLISASSCAFSSQRILYKPRWPKRKKADLFSVNASSSDEESDCNVDDCAPDKEVGKVSMEWLVGERTKVVGTFPPRKRGWTGYVEKDTAGQTNIYSIEPSVYVAESAISSGNAGTSADGAENIVAITAGLALISIAAASFVLIQVDKNEPQVQRVDYNGPPLSYYINRFKPATVVEASVPLVPESSPSVEASVPPESASSTVQASAASEPKILSELQSENNANMVPEVQKELKETVEASTVSNAS